MKIVLKAFTILTIIFLTAGCTTEKKVDIDEWIIPYKEILAELNAENGWTLSIVDQDVFYDTYRDCSPEEAKTCIEEIYRAGLTVNSSLPDNVKMD